MRRKWNPVDWQALFAWWPARVFVRPPETAFPGWTLGLALPATVGPLTGGLTALAFGAGPGWVTGLVGAGAAGLLSLSLAAQDRLRRDGQTFRAMADGAADMLACHDREGRMIYVSPQARQVLGIDPRSLRGRTLHGHIHPSDWNPLEQFLAGLRRTGRSGAVELRMRHPDGRYRLIEIRMAPLPQDSLTDAPRPAPVEAGGSPGSALMASGVSGFVAIYRDVGASREREARLYRERDRALKASDAKSRFLAGVSHELRTPLNSIIGFSEVMRAEIFGPLGSPRYREYADYVHESGCHLLDLINDILDMSKIEAGRYELRMETVRMPIVIERCLKTIAFEARSAGLKLAVEIPHSIPTLEADPRAMRQILLNLLSNAIKFTPEGGEVRLILRRELNWVVLEVRDTGIGIPAEALGRIGRPFEQVNPSSRFETETGQAGSRPGTPGTGLGLAIVKALVTLHKGVLTIHSEEGAGTSVRVRLPLSQPEVAPQPDQGPMALPAPASLSSAQQDGQAAGGTLEAA